ncbi:MAG: hypothetical protein MMC33_004532 [Icmadophila ericetorum]|nr:hypothetical protein [Icmadophila ericetorum]
MFGFSWTVLAFVASAVPYGAAQVQTWPSSMDELEDIQQLNTGYRARGFSSFVTPCGFSAQGPGRITAAEWIRTAFHDMATANTFFGTGGIDASLLYELGGDNIGAAFNQSLFNFGQFYTSRSSLSDLIAMGVYTAVRACSGPVIPIRTGRIDATAAGPGGVPLPQNSLYTFEQQFLRMGFNTTEMIILTACGHTVGGVHSVNFPQIVPAGTAPNGYQIFDGTDAFDTKIATNYIAGSPEIVDPLDVGPSVAAGFDSDNLVFGADNNVTMQTLTDPTYFASTCQTLLQRLIEVVPTGVTLTNPIVQYDIKPNVLQLTLLAGGSQLTFTGEIRVRTTITPANQIKSVQLVYQDRTGGSNCGAAGCTISTAAVGTAAGFDDSYSFYGFSTTLPTSSSISAFNVLVTLTSGSTVTYNNNGIGYPVQDTIMLQSPQSCLTSTGALTVVAAVRNTVTTLPNLDVTQYVPRTNCCPTSTLPVPALQSTTVNMTQVGAAVGPYTLYTASFTLAAGDNDNSKVDVTVGSFGDTFKNTGDLGATCATLGSGSTSSSTTTTSSSIPPSSTTSTITTKPSTTSTTSTKSTTSSTTTTKPSSTTSPTSKPTTTTTSTTSSTSSTSSTKASSTTSSSTKASSSVSSSTSTSTSTSPPTATPSLNGYNYQGCYTDATDSRVLTGVSTSTGSMTWASCSAFCTGYNFFGVEYGSECYCGNAFVNPTSVAPATDCNMACTGNATEVCGAGARLNLFKAKTTVNPIHNVTIPGYIYEGCYTDSTKARVLVNNSMASGAMTVQQCSTFCAGFMYFGAEFSTQCFCGGKLAVSTTKVADGQCGYECSGNSTQFCGGAGLLSLYMKDTASN